MSGQKVSRGLACPRCGARGVRAVWSIPLDGRLVRIRGCRACGDAFITSEEVVPDGRAVADARGKRR